MDDNISRLNLEIISKNTKIISLRNEIEELGTAYENAQKEIIILNNKIARLKEVLSFYADKSNYDDRGAYWDIIADEGKRAREGLGLDE